MYQKGSLSASTHAYIYGVPVHARLGVIGAFNGNSTDALLVGMLRSGILARIEAIVNAAGTPVGLGTTAEVAARSSNGGTDGGEEGYGKSRALHGWLRGCGYVL